MAFMVSCAFQPGVSPFGPITCDDFEAVPFTPLTSQTSQIVLQDPGIITVIHGTGSAKHNSGEAAKAIRVEQSLQIPPFANNATVFLNGWGLKYLDDEHNVLALGTIIAKIRFDPRTHTLTWNALGLLRDDDGKKGYDWTYRYTVIAWNNAQINGINAVVDHGIVDASNNYCKSPLGTHGPMSDNYFYATNDGMNTALSSFRSFIQNSAFATSRTVAVLPRGFAFVLTGGDRHVFQVAYNLDHSEIFAEKKRKYQKAHESVDAPLPTLASRADSGFVSWTPYAILKDNDGRRDYYFGEIVSAMGGNDVGVVQPPYSILPAEDYGMFGNWGCGAVGGPATTEEYVIENVPFQYAVPMLSGWELKYLCDDRHVREIGIWIDEWSYQIAPGATAGTLRYKLSSTLQTFGFLKSHKVTVLGLRSVAGVNVIMKKKGD
jgi:hypothetical protein